ncbi:VOC family protein [Methylocapsa sp. S129]|uniref:VOC family protein n=1 Tax=Methylocapsa sp. S129 TaxID=1641869 RepID=UPI00131AD17D|nr:VOC family protein [Methylocapsa sp. S129]
MPLSVNAIDHFVIRVADLDAGEKLFTRLGFTLTPRGFHAGRGSANHTAPLSSGNYFEIIYWPAGADAPFPERPEGPVALALAPSDSHIVYAELTALGYKIEPPRDLARPVHLPEGTREARFVNVSFPPIAPEAIGFFACQHLTRDLVWRPEWEAQPNGAERVTGVIVVHPSPADLQATYVRLYGEAAVSIYADGLIVTLGGDKISFLAPEAFKRRFPAVAVPKDSANGWFAGATLRVRSLDKVAAILVGAGIAASRTPSGSLVVAPSEAANTLLEFEAA